MRYHWCCHCLLFPSLRRWVPGGHSLAFSLPLPPQGSSEICGVSLHTTAAFQVGDLCEPSPCQSLGLLLHYGARGRAGRPHQEVPAGPMI